MTSTSEAPAPRANRIITFYSYKGGVGRSMALANVAALLARLGRRVLVIDFDLEAPGIERYFDQPGLLERSSSADPENDPGLVDIFIGIRDGVPVDWRRCVTEFNGPSLTAPLHLIQAGNRSKDYATKAQSLNWDRLFADHDLGARLAELRAQWSEAYDIVLIDSRTGVSDIGGICTILLPDALVMLFTANRQSIEGTAEVARLARLAQERLPVERARLQIIPLLSRDDRRTEYEQSERWRGIVAEAMTSFFNEWVWEGVSAERVLTRFYLPQVAFWSFGERLPVVERPAELDDPGTLGAAYSLLAKLIDLDLNWRAIDDESRISLPSVAADSLPPPSPLAGLVPKAIIGLLAAVLAVAVAGTYYVLKPNVASDMTSPNNAMADPYPGAGLTIEGAQAVVGSPESTAIQRIDAMNFLAGNGAVPRGAMLNSLEQSPKLSKLPGCVQCSLENASLLGVIFDKGIFTGTSFVRARLSGASFIGATLEDVDFSGADLTNAIFSGAQFKNVNVKGARLARDQLSAEQRKAIVGTPAWITPAAEMSGRRASVSAPIPGTQLVGGNADDGWDVDVFWCEGPAGDRNYKNAQKVAQALAAAADEKQALAPGVMLGRVRLKSLSSVSQKSGAFFLGAHYVTADSGPGEIAAAEAISKTLKARAGAYYAVKRSVGATTSWYISVFACATE